MAKSKLVTEEMLNDALQSVMNGLHYSKSYEKIFTESDWIEADGQYTITITNSEHKLPYINTADLFKLADNGYVISHGIFDNLDYTIIINNNIITITTTNTFSGKIVLICNNYNSEGASTNTKLYSPNFADNFNLI